jgi:hypothetical protein
MNTDLGLNNCDKGWAFMTTEDLRSLDFLVLFDDHDETFSTHTSSEATGMTRIKLALATLLSLASHNTKSVIERINNKHENHTHSSNSLSHGAIL